MHRYCLLFSTVIQLGRVLVIRKPNRYGLNFRLSDPAFMLGEFQFRRNRQR